MLREDVEGVGIVQGEHEDGGLRVLVVAGGDAGHPLHAARVPQLQLHLLLAGSEDLAVVVQSYRRLPVSRAGEGVAHEPSEQGGLANPVLATENDLLLGYLDRGLNTNTINIISVVRNILPSPWCVVLSLL